jgi:hypothetical protein
MKIHPLRPRKSDDAPRWPALRREHIRIGKSTRIGWFVLGWLVAYS